MSFAVPFIPYVMAGASAVQGIMGAQEASYQARVAENNANLVAETAARERHAADLDMQTKDLDARAELGSLVAQMSASGLDASSGSMLARRQGLEYLSSRDRERLGQKRDVAFENRKREEKSLRDEASALRSKRRMGMITTALSIPTSFLSGASMVNQYSAGRLGLTNPA